MIVRSKKQEVHTAPKMEPLTTHANNRNHHVDHFSVHDLTPKTPLCPSKYRFIQSHACPTVSGSNTSYASPLPLTRVSRLDEVRRSPLGRQRKFAHQGEGGDVRQGLEMLFVAIRWGEIE